jgi:hypothetical protein
VSDQRGDGRAFRTPRSPQTPAQRTPASAASYGGHCGSRPPPMQPLVRAMSARSSPGRQCPASQGPHRAADAGIGHSALRPAATGSLARPRCHRRRRVSPRLGDPAAGEQDARPSRSRFGVSGISATGTRSRGPSRRRRAGSGRARSSTCTGGLVSTDVADLDLAA